MEKGFPSSPIAGSQLGKGFYWMQKTKHIWWFCIQGDMLNIHQFTTFVWLHKIEGHMYPRLPIGKPQVLCCYMLLLWMCLYFASIMLNPSSGGVYCPLKIWINRLLGDTIDGKVFHMSFKANMLFLTAMCWMHGVSWPSRGGEQANDSRFGPRCGSRFRVPFPHLTRRECAEGWLSCWCHVWTTRWPSGWWEPYFSRKTSVIIYTI